MLCFSDNISIDTSGPLRKLCLYDGLYVVGDGMLVPVADDAEAEEIIQSVGYRHAALTNHS